MFPRIKLTIQIITILLAGLPVVLYAQSADGVNSDTSDLTSQNYGLEKLSKRSYFELGFGIRHSFVRKYGFIGSEDVVSNYISRTRTMLNASIGGSIAVWSIHPMWLMSIAPSFNVSTYINNQEVTTGLPDDDEGLYGEMYVPVLATVTYGALGRKKQPFGISGGLGFSLNSSGYLQEGWYLSSIAQLEVIFIPNKTVTKLKAFVEVFAVQAPDNVSARTLTIQLCFGW